MTRDRILPGSLLRRLARGRMRLSYLQEKPGHLAVAELFGEDAETAVLIGRAYLAATGGSKGAIAKLARRLNGCASPARALDELRSAARKDLAQGRSFVLDGWVMAEAGAQACALISAAAEAGSGAGGVSPPARPAPSR
jgi:hypothetical protein